MNVNILRGLDIVIKKPHILRPIADFKYVPLASIGRVAMTYLESTSFSFLWYSKS